MPSCTDNPKELWPGITAVTRFMRGKADGTDLNDLPRTQGLGCTSGYGSRSLPVIVAELLVGEGGSVDFSG